MSDGPDPDEPIVVPRRLLQAIFELAGSGHGGALGLVDRARETEMVNDLNAVADLLGDPGPREEAPRGPTRRHGR